VRYSTLVVWAVLVTVLLEQPASGQVGECIEAEPQLTALLASSSRPTLRIDLIRDVAFFSGVEFCRAMLAPPGRVGHPGRDPLATMVFAGENQYLVRNVSDLARVWALNGLVAESRKEAVLQAVVGLLNATGTVLEGQILRDSRAVARMFEGTIERRVLGRVRAPRVDRAEDGWRIRLFALGDLGIDEYVILARGDGSFDVSKVHFPSLLEF
jgi:hypothetical protein